MFVRVFIILAFCVSFVFAVSVQTLPHTKARLISFVKNPQKGGSFWVALTLEPQKGWHTYWDNPGDSGLRTNMIWDLPRGISVEKTLSSTPQRIKTENIITYGYAKTAVHFAHIHVPKDFDGTTLTINLKADWLVCEDSCIPQHASLSLTLPIAPIHEKPEPLHNDLFNAWMKDVPTAIVSPLTPEVKNDELSLTIPKSVMPLSKETVAHIYLLPRKDMGFSYRSIPMFDVTENGTNLHIPLFPKNAKTENTSGLILIEHKDGAHKAYDVIFNGSIEHKESNNFSLVFVLLFAFLGGIILNAMPCVFPILSLKAFSLAQSHSRVQAKTQGLAYTLGVLVSFVILGLSVIILKQGGMAVGWGFQMQSPVFVMVMIYLLFLIGLNLSGYFEIMWTSGERGQRFTEAHNNNRSNSSHFRASFFTGVLATAVATPCTAPFMGVAVGYALSSTNDVLLLTMVALGFGLALPFLIISFVPMLQRVLPRPGMWMVTFREFLAFPMYASVIWLVWVIIQQTGSEGLLLSGAGLLLCVMTLWLWKKITIDNPFFRGIFWFILICIVLSPMVILHHHQSQPLMKVTRDNTYSKKRLEALLFEKKTVFVYATAAWCITCKFNEVAIKSATVQQYFKDNDIHVLVADWTNNDPEVTDFLNDFGRKGVPLYVFYSNNNEKPIILSQLLTEGNLLASLSGR